MNVTIEKVQFATADLVGALNRLLPQLSSTPPTLSITDLERLLHSDSASLFVAKDGPRIVGTLTLITFRIPTGRRAWIEDVVVDAEARGEGIGEKLTSAAIGEARARGARTIDLTSRPSREAANALYQKMGFEQRETNVYRLILDS